MNRVTITLHIDLPDGVVPDVQYSSLEEPPFPVEAPQYDRDAIAAPVAAFPPFSPPAAPHCQLHGEMKRYPAGVSKKTGKPFSASWRCTANGCTTAPLWDKDVAA